jgi:peptidoglycan/LPS O-acetylase OafA/YrhL
MPSTTTCALCRRQIDPARATYNDDGQLVCDPPCQAPRAAASTGSPVIAFAPPAPMSGNAARGRIIFIVLTVATILITALFLIPKGEHYDPVRACGCSVLPVGGWVLSFFGHGRGLKWLVLLYGGFGFAMFILAYVGVTGGNASFGGMIAMVAIGVVCLVLAGLCFSSDLHTYLSSRALARNTRRPR